MLFVIIIKPIWTAFQKKKNPYIWLALSIGNIFRILLSGRYAIYLGVFITQQE